MAINLDEFQRLKREADAARRKADEAAGAAKQVMAQLAERGLKSIADAEKRQAKLDKELVELEGQFNQGLTEYREKFK